MILFRCKYQIINGINKFKLMKIMIIVLVYHSIVLGLIFICQNMFDHKNLTESKLQAKLRKQIDESAENGSDDMNSQEDYQLVPRQQCIHPIKKDRVLVQRSFPYKHEAINQINLNMIQHSSIQSAYQNNSEGIQANNINQLEINQSFISKSSSQQNKNISLKADRQFQSNLQLNKNISVQRLQNRKSNDNKFHENLKYSQNYRYSFGRGNQYVQQQKNQFIKIQTIQSQTILAPNKQFNSPVTYQKKKNHEKNSQYQKEQYQSHLSIQKHQGFQQVNQYSRLREQNKRKNQKLIQSQHQIQLNRIKIEELRDQLIKSSQNNINALFNTQIHEEVCLIHQVQKMKTQVQNIKFKLANVNQTHNTQQRNFLHNCFGHRQNCQKQQNYFMQMQAKNKHLSKKYYQLANQIQSVSTNQTMFSRQLQKLKQSFEIGIMEKVQDLLKFRLLEEKNRRQIQQIQQFQEFQYAPIIKPESTQQDEQFDYSRGSISVIYIQRLRQFQILVQDKQNTICELKRQNLFLKKSLQKLQAIRYQDRKSQISKPNATQNKNQGSNIAALFKKRNQLFDISDSVSIEQKNIQQNLITKNYEGAIDFVNKKKNTHSFHQSKNVQQKAVQQLQQKLKTYELIIKQKDIRIKELENTIMDHLQTNSFQKNNKNHSYSFHSISADSKQQNTQILQSKVHNLKTLLLQTRKQNKQLKFQLEDALYSKSTRNTIHSKQDSQITKSICRSQKTIKNNYKNYKAEGQILCPFKQLQVQEKNNQNYHKQLSKAQDKNKLIITFINESLCMIQNLRQIVLCFCSQKIDASKIQESIRSLILQLKCSDQLIYEDVKKVSALCYQFS